MEETRWLDDREQAAWRGLLSMQAKLGARLRRAHQHDSGLSDSDYAVLVHVSEAPEGRLRIFELGAQLEWEKSRLSHHLRRMEQRELIRREECDTDRRGAFVVLTPAGRVAIERAAPKHVAAVRDAFIDVLTPDQLEAIQEITGQVIEHLSKSDTD